MRPIRKGHANPFHRGQPESNSEMGSGLDEKHTACLPSPGLANGGVDHKVETKKAEIATEMRTR